MTLKTLVATACVATLSMTSTAALAQARPAAPAPAQPAARPAQPAINHGPAVGGVCIINQRASIEATNAVQAIESKINAEFSTEGQRLQQELAAYEGKPVTQVPEALRKRYEEFNTRLNNRRANLQPPERQAQERIAAEALPTIAEVYQQRRCSVLLDSAVVVTGNPAMDITRAVIDRLNQKVPAPALAAAPAPAAPARR